MSTIILITAFVSLIAHSQAANFSSLQQIVGFPKKCSDAYNTELNDCKGIDFAPFSDNANCNQACFNQVNGLMSVIQAACAGTGAAPDTVMGHVFLSDIGYWLCGVGQFADKPVPTIGSGPASNLLSTDTSSSTSDAASTTSADVSSTTSSTVVTSTASTASPRSTSSSPRPTVTGGNNQGGLNGLGDSTPFDQLASKNDATSAFLSSYLLLALGLVLAV